MISPTYTTRVQLGVENTEVVVAGISSNLSRITAVSFLSGPKGDTGPQGPPGQRGAVGATGPNEVSTATNTNITGIIKGIGSTVAAAIAGEDYLAPVDNISPEVVSGLPAYKLTSLQGVGKAWQLAASYNDADSFSLIDGTNQRLYVKSDGKIGINTTSPSAQLDVGGDIAASGNVSINGTPSNSTHAITKGIFDAAIADKIPKGTYYVNIADYSGVLDDGVHDNTAAFITATIDALASGLKLYVPTPAVAWRLDGCWKIPYTVLSTRIKQRPLTIVGDGPTWDGTWLSDPINGGSIIDMRYDNTDGLDGEYAAKFVTMGAGYLEITGVTFKSGGDDNFPFIQTTNTTPFIHKCAFIGNMAGYQETCEQDAVILGGTNNGENSDDWQAGFQGYGGKLADNYYSHIRSNVFQTYANAFEIDNETWSTSCGSNRAHPAPYHVEPMPGFGASGNKWRGGTVEMTGYKHGVCLMNDSQANVIDNIGLYDDGNEAVSYVYCGASNTSFNEIHVGLFNYSCPAASGPSAKEQLVIDARAQASYFPYGVDAKTLSFSNGVGEPKQAKFNNVGREWSSVTTDTPDGGPMSINTGPGGSYFDLTVYSLRINDHQDDLMMELMPGKAKGALRILGGTTGNRPSAATAGQGSLWYDTTLDNFICSNGAAWNVIPLDSALVHLAGNESVAGVKTFSSNPIVSSGLPGYRVVSTQGAGKTWEWVASYNDADSLTLRDGTNQRLYVKSDGKIGIGTTTPGAQLGIGGGIEATSDVEVTDYGKGVVLHSPNGSRWRLTVNDSGTIVTTSI